MDIEKYKAAWKSGQSFEKNSLSEADIQNFMKRRSKEINKLFRKGLLLDMVLKSTIGVSFIILSVLFFSSMKVLVISSLLFAGIIMAIFFQGSMLKKIPYVDYAIDNLRKVLENTINFYKNKYLRSLYVGALSNPLFIISGMLYYFYFKYGEVRPLEMDDYFVFGITIILGFLLGAYAQLKQYNFHIQQLEHSLIEIDETTITELTIKRQNYKKRQMFLIFLFALICGFLVLAFIFART